MPHAGGVLIAALNVQLPASEAGQELPREFKLLGFGKNSTTKGDLIFDKESARSVMAAYRKHGVDVAIDLEHLSIDPEHPNYDPNARGYCNLELRADGLWAVNVRWNADGAARIQGLTQKYISPAVYHTKGGRVVQILNIALCAQPATDNARPLIAASRRYLMRLTMLDVEQVKKAIEAMRNDDGDAALTILENLIAAAASGGSEPPAEPAPMSEPAAEPAPSAEEPKPEEELAAASQLIALAGGKPMSEALELFSAWKKSHDSLEAERAAVRADRARVEADERDALVAELVTLGRETPGEAWADPTVATDRAKRKPAEFLAALSISALRDRVKRAKADPRAQGDLRPPAAGTSSVPGLTAEQLAMCERNKCPPEVFLAQLNRTA